ncbi:MAG: hypothetical protein KY464_13975, partial [Gemmatimonadetes bacterium]|nr:hypothetical protein [Gemmatimonadota bacterium]
MSEALMKGKLRNAALAIAAVLTLSCGPSSVRAQGAPILAGVAVTDITPPVGYPQYRGVSTAVHDRLYAKALVL